MIKRNTIFDCLTQVMVIWGVSVLSLCLFCHLFGEDAKGVSSIFDLGNTGVPVATLMQFFLLAILITGMKYLFFTDIVIKNLRIIVRSILMFAGVIVWIAVFAAAFRWFPVNQAKPWLMFFVCFAVCSSISVAVSAVKEKSDNRKLQEALERMKGDEFQ